jgi:hypothetical protein
MTIADGMHRIVDNNINGIWTSRVTRVWIPALILVIAIVGFATAYPVSLPVDLGTAGNFVILSKSGISTTGTTEVTGDIGVSPIDSTAITGFGLVMDASNTFSRSSLVTGKCFAADYTPPTPSLMTTAISNMETAFTDAAGRAPDVTELGSGDISTMNLAPGVYKWSTGVSINDDVTLTGGPTAVWIFEISQDLTVASNKKVVLAGGALPKNIFWQVGTQATLGTGSHVEGNILAGTLIAMNTGASLNGRALAQKAVTLDSNAVVFPASAPPSSGKIGVYRNDYNWYLDLNGNGKWDNAVVDLQRSLGAVGDVPVTGDWNGDGITEIGVWRNNHYWYLDYNGNGVWDSLILDNKSAFGSPGDVPVTGDWNGDLRTEIGVFRNNHFWFLDYNGNGKWDNVVLDNKSIFGAPGDVPVTGDWNGNGKTKIGLYRGNHFWFLDYNGNGKWDSIVLDNKSRFGAVGDVPVTGDWNSNGITEIGLFRNNWYWYLDMNGNGKWDAGIDKRSTLGGVGDVPVTGRW